MNLGSREHEEAMAMFEKVFPHVRLDREAKEFWPRGNVYQSGETNDLFLAFQHGVAYGHAINA